MRILIVKLSSMGDVIHALPVVQDLRAAFPGAAIDWVVEPAFSPLVRRAAGIADVVDAPIRKWSKALLSLATTNEILEFRSRLRLHRYQAILDLQGLTKSALVSATARGHRFAMANRTEGSSYEAPTRWVAQSSIKMTPRIHALDRSRVFAAKALGYEFSGAPNFGLAVATIEPVQTRTVVFLHGTSRDDKLWPEADWIALGKLLIRDGWQIALPRGTESEGQRAQKIAAELGLRCEVWPVMPLGLLVDKMRLCQAAIGVDSGLSHLAVALDLPHVQIYNLPTAWRTGPLIEHGHKHQVAIEGRPIPSLAAVVAAWELVTGIVIRGPTEHHAVRTETVPQAKSSSIHAEPPTSSED